MSAENAPKGGVSQIVAAKRDRAQVSTAGVA